MNQPDDPAAPAPAAGPAVTPTPLAPQSPSDHVPALAWVIGAVFVAVELAVSGRYGFQQDELYFIVAGHHLGFGYVDQPPLVPLLTRITDILGVSPTAIRVIPALALHVGRRVWWPGRLSKQAPPPESVPAPPAEAVHVG